MNAVSISYCPSQIWGVHFIMFLHSSHDGRHIAKEAFIHMEIRVGFTLQVTLSCIIQAMFLSALNFPWMLASCDKATILRDIIKWMFCI